ncbi:MAG: lysine--tRNA ligase, partial [Clostridiales bacterium]|nr:lysine--tRNA ligase [Clostridiales bacterium]
MADENAVVTPEEESPELEQQNTNELRRIRLEKLQALQAAGKDPFEITLADQNIIASEISERFEELEGKDVS